MKRLYILGLLLWCVVGVSAQGLRDSLQTYYKVGSSHIDTLYMRNGESMSSFFQRNLAWFERPDFELPETAIIESSLPAGSQMPEVTSAKKQVYWALKTNVLYDLALVPNIGIEFFIGKQWSVAANWMYAWWSHSGKDNFWRIYGGDVEVRRWFGKKAEEKPLQGHHIGVYGQLFTYDFETGGRGYLGDKWSYAFGLSYGYSLPLTKRLNLDFNLGLGYWGGKYKEYLPVEGHYVWQSTKQRHWWGPTKAEVSLVWLLGKSNFNQQKGGRQ